MLTDIVLMKALTRNASPPCKVMARGRLSWVCHRNVRSLPPRLLAPVSPTPYNARTTAGFNCVFV